MAAGLQEERGAVGGGERGVAWGVDGGSGGEFDGMSGRREPLHERKLLWNRLSIRAHRNPSTSASTTITLCPKVERCLIIVWIALVEFSDSGLQISALASREEHLRELFTSRIILFLLLFGLFAGGTVFAVDGGVAVVWVLGLVGGFCFEGFLLPSFTLASGEGAPAYANDLGDCRVVCFQRSGNGFSGYEIGTKEDKSVWWTWNVTGGGLARVGGGLVCGPVCSGGYVVCIKVVEDVCGSLARVARCRIGRRRRGGG